MGGAGAAESTFPAHAMEARININAEDRMKMLREEKISLIMLLYSANSGLKSALHVYGNCISDGEIG